MSYEAPHVWRVDVIAETLTVNFPIVSVTYQGRR